MFTKSKVNNSETIKELKKEAGDFTESGYLLTDEYIERLARSVFTASKLPDGDEYVAIIGHGYEKSNRDAVETFVMNHLDELSEVHGIHHLETILNLIQGRFNDIEYFFCS